VATISNGEDFVFCLAAGRASRRAGIATLTRCKERRLGGLLNMLKLYPLPRRLAEKFTASGRFFLKTPTGHSQ
jgi:hypothetical protein